MCFRPPSFDDMMKTCPNCGGFNPPEATKCKKCGADLPSNDGNDAPTSGPSAPTAPKGPMAPGGPKGPMAPGAPKAPGA